MTNEQLNTALDSILAECREILEAGEKTPDGPYRVTGTDHKNGIDYVKVRGTRLGQKWQIADVRFIRDGNYTEEPEAYQLASFLALSRSITPKLAKNTIKEIEWLREQMKMSRDVCEFEPNVQSFKDANASFEQDIFDRLIEIVTDWSEQG